MSSSQKTITINPDLFVHRDGKTKSKGKNTTEKAPRREKKQRPKIGGNRHASTLRKSLLKKIKEHQQKENYTTKRENNNKKNKTNGNSDSDNPVFDDEFTRSLAYLSALAETKRNDKHKAKAMKGNQQTQQTSHQIQVNTQPQLQPQPRLHIPLDVARTTKPLPKPVVNTVTTNVNNIITHNTESISNVNPFGKSSGGTLHNAIATYNPLLSKSHNRTLKHVRPISDMDAVSLELPDTLKPKLDIELAASDTNISSIPEISQLNIPLQAPLQSNVISHNTVRLGNDNTVITREPDDVVQKIITSKPQYGVLRGGMKPTYKEYVKTQRSYNTLQTQKPNITIYDHKPKIVQSVREQKLDELKAKAREQHSSNGIHIALGGNSLAKRNNNTESDNGEKRKTRMRTKTLRRTTTVTRFKLGRDAKKRTVSVLIKNNNTRRRIKKEIGDLKKTGTKEIKQYLKKHGLLKSGSSAPSDILRKIYEQAVLAGDINNVSKDTLLHNYLHDDDVVW